MKRAIVLSGGGAKGAYEVGVLKALKKLGIKYDIITGTSVGSLNGVLFVQKDIKTAERLWKNMNFSFVFDEDVLEKFNNAQTTADMLSMFSTNFFKNGGMGVENLENAVNKAINKKKFFNSEIDFGICTYNLSKNKALRIKKSELNNDNIVDYVMASSSCYPAIKKRKIGNDNFIDGGIFDNLPINLAIEMGADEVIAIDLKAPGIKEKVKYKNIPITYLIPRNNIGNFLDFSTINARNAIKYGFNDTMKYYGKLDGELYTFKRYNLNRNHDRYNDKLINNLNKLFDFDEGKTTLDEIIRLAAFKRMTSIKKGNSNKIINDLVEYLGDIFNMDNTKCYKINRYNRLLIKKVKKSIKLDDNKIKEFSKLSILDVVNKRSIIKYFYCNFDRCMNDNKIKKYFTKLALTFPKEFLSALYLYTVKGELWIW